MNAPKAFGLGIVLYLILFLVATTAMFLFGIPNTGAVLVIVTPLFCIPLSYFYLEDMQRGHFMESIELGFAWIVLTIVLDIGAFIPLFGLGWSYFDSVLAWVKYGELLFFSVLIGMLLEGAQDRSPFKEYKNNSNR